MIKKEMTTVHIDKKLLTKGKKVLSKQIGNNFYITSTNIVEQALKEFIEKGNK